MQQFSHCIGRQNSHFLIKGQNIRLDLAYRQHAKVEPHILSHDLKHNFIYKRQKMFPVQVRK